MFTVVRRINGSAASSGIESRAFRLGIPFLLVVMLIPNFPRRTDMLMAGLSVSLRVCDGPAHAIKLSEFGKAHALAPEALADCHSHSPTGRKLTAKPFCRSGQPVSSDIGDWTPATRRPPILRSGPTRHKPVNALRFPASVRGGARRTVMSEGVQSPMSPDSPPLRRNTRFSLQKIDRVRACLQCGEGPGYCVGREPQHYISLANYTTVGAVDL